MDQDLTRTTIWVDGVVQGVGFRWWVQRRARELGLAGAAENLIDGRVQVDAQGPADQVATLVADLTSKPARIRRPGHVTEYLVEHRAVDPRLHSFDVR
ncbi:MAG: acylphosphatase [Propioniciclava sp.]